MALFVHHDRAHVGRGQRADHKLRRVLAPQHNVDPLAGQLVGHTVDTGAAHADAGADGVYAFVMREHRNLGARTGIAGAGFDLQHTLFNLRHFLAEQLNHEFGRGARQHDGRAAQRQVDFHDHGAHAVAGAEVFLRNHFRAAQAAFDPAVLDNQIALVHALDRAGENFVAA